MKKKYILLIFIVIFCSIFYIDNVFATTKYCRYKITYNNGVDNYTDYITFEFVLGEGITTKFYIESTNEYYEMDKNNWKADGKIFTDKNFYIDHPDMSDINGIVFTKDRHVCPDTLSYFGFGYYYTYDGYLLGHVAYHSGQFDNLGSIQLEEKVTEEPPSDIPEEDGKCVCCGRDKDNCTYSWIHKNQQPGYSCTGVELTKSECTGSIGSPTGYEKKYCSEAYVVSKYSSTPASDSKYYSLKVQYYIEDNRKYIEMTPIRGDQISSPKKSFELHPDVGNIVDIGDYKAESGKYFRVETFDQCDNVKMVACEVDDLNADKIYIGPTCNEINGGNPETEHELQNLEKYKSEWKKKWGSKTFIIPTPGGGGFGNEADCKKTVGAAGYTIIHGVLRAVQLLAPVVAIVIAMITLIPAVTAKDEAGIKKASKTCVTIGVVLVVIEVVPYLVILIGRILGYDLSCLV